MHATEANLLAAGLHKNDAADIAHNLLDMDEDLTALTTFIKKASAKAKLQKSEIKKNLQYLEFHIPYHVQELTRIVKRDRVQAFFERVAR